MIHQCCPTHTEAIAAYRFLNNPRVTMEMLSQALVDPLAPSAAGKHVLCIQDTTEINYSAHSGRLRANDAHLGPVANSRDVGFFLHPSLVLEAETGVALGFADVHLWSRSWEQEDKHTRGYKGLPIEQKESYRWLAAAQQAKATLQQAEQVTIVADREADIYAFFSRVPDGRTEVVIRAAQPRRVRASADAAAPVQQLEAYLATLPWAGSLTAAVRTSAKRRQREAHLQVRFGPVQVLAPRSAAPQDAPSLGLYALEVVEAASSVPADEEPIRWCLLTTHPVTTRAEAIQVIGYYKQRWQIEQLFRLLKRKGLALEASQLTRGAALQKLCVLSLQVALVQLQLVQARDGRSSHRATLVFRAAMLGLLEALQKSLEGRTVKQQCPHEAGSLAWASWIVGRLGGWKGYASQSPPGPITMRRGLERLESQYAGWLLAQQMSTPQAR